MTDQQIQDLFYLVHDKSHIMQPGTVSPEVADLINALRTRQTVTLWRGLCKEDVVFLDSMFNARDAFRTWSCALSMTESKSYAKKFSHGYKTKALLRVLCHRTKTTERPLGLNVVEALVANINTKDEGEVDMLALARIEQEWIFNRPRVAPVSHIVNKDGYSVYTVNLITL
ncbi:RNA polymerase ADP-ribosylase [Salmonella phage barely]|uniref:Uncharacterized protein n=2 Tax=Caudoviricetes TaxID=2731619 RepID=A0A6G8RNT6_9CAUD|nr:RNA polymerase ADP-ribosylase [Salmonella phage barely]QIO03067.1 hypothetical protein barely_59 [Salmonella phage barely]QOE31928.1 hypothetical protein ISTP3_orf00121 [Salmonella phage ISTP3]